MNEEVQNLNTSHVKVQLLFNLMKKILLPNLNTSHVKVQHDIEELMINYCLFKYISC